MCCFMIKQWNELFQQNMTACKWFYVDVGGSNFSSIVLFVFSFQKDWFNPLPVNIILG